MRSGSKKPDDQRHRLALVTTEKFRAGGDFILTHTPTLHPSLGEGQAADGAIKGTIIFPLRTVAWVARPAGGKIGYLNLN